MPVMFFVSSIAAGTALVVLVEMWIAKAWNRTIRVAQLAAMGKVAFLSLAAYLALRVGDLAVRGELAGAFAKPLFLLEVGVGGFVALALLSSAKLRTNQKLLGLGAFLSMGGIVLNRVATVVLAMNLKGIAPQNAPQSYHPSIVEWGVSIGLIAATIFLFGLGARLMPVLPKDEGKDETGVRAA
jgi:formate dehydrogenase iron-sulfur subunit